MEEIIVKFKDYLKAINRFSEDDFQKSKHHDIYFSLNKLVEIIKKDINPSTSKLKEFGSYKYILFSEIYNILKTITDVR